MDDATLNSALEQAQQGDKAAFGRVYEHFATRVFRLCNKLLRSRAAAEDATSEVFERAQLALESYDRGRPFERWLLAIASRHCLNHLRRSRTERRLFHDDPPELATAAASHSPLALCETRQERDALQQAIDRLSENYRLPVILKYYCDLSYDEIANELGMTRDNVAVSLHRAKRELRLTLGSWQKEKA